MQIVKIYLLIFCVFIHAVVWGYKGYENTILDSFDPLELNAEKLLDFGFKLDQHGYIGQRNEEGEMHGRGVLRIKKREGGGEYTGEWRKNMRHGIGRVVTGENDEYVGDWRFDRQHGFGNLTTSDGDKYVGQWKFGEQEGEGTYKWVNGHSYTGAWLESEPHGFGISVEENTKYKGEWSNGKKHGKGIVTRLSDGKVLFNGNFEQDRPIK